MKIMNLYELALLLRAKLKMAKWPFNRYGFPVFPREVILEEPPTLIEPIQRIRCCKKPNENLLSSFSDDLFIKRRLQRIFEEINLYGHFKGFGGFDLSPRIRWPFQQQSSTYGFLSWLPHLLPCRDKRLFPTLGQETCKLYLHWNHIRKIFPMSQGRWDALKKCDLFTNSSDIGEHQRDYQSIRTRCPCRSSWQQGRVA